MLLLNQTVGYTHHTLYMISSYREPKDRITFWSKLSDASLAVVIIAEVTSIRFIDNAERLWIGNGKRWYWRFLIFVLPMIVVLSLTSPLLEILYPSSRHCGIYSIACRVHHRERKVPCPEDCGFIKMNELHKSLNSSPLHLPNSRLLLIYALSERHVW